MSSASAKAALAAAFPRTMAGQWKRLDKVDTVMGVFRTFRHEKLALEIVTLEKTDGSIEIRGPRKQRTGPPGGMPTMAEIVSGRCKIV